MAILNLEDKRFFDAAINTPVPILIDFWAEWCFPCKTMLPILEDLSETEDIVVAKVNVDDLPELAEGITSIPTMRVYVNGEVVKEIVGAKPKPALLVELQEFLKEDA